jgi:hypothetical protein
MPEHNIILRQICNMWLDDDDDDDDDDDNN